MLKGVLGGVLCVEGKAYLLVLLRFGKLWGFRWHWGVFLLFEELYFQEVGKGIK